MQQFLIITANSVLLVFLLIGRPAAARAQWGNLQVSSASTNQNLMFFGLVIGAAANILAALKLFKIRKHKILCWEWAAVLGALLLADYGFTRGYFNFDWLKHALDWMQKRL